MINLLGILEESEVNGPGKRMVIWFQGCHRHCVGCFNPESWDFSARHLWEVDDLVERIKKADPEGLTISGGEPFEQSEELLALLRGLHEGDTLIGLPKGIISFTGYQYEELLRKNRTTRDCLSYIDVVIDGAFEEGLKQEHQLCGSSNQRFHFLEQTDRGKERVKADELSIDQAIEIHIVEDEIVVTGFY